MNITIGNMAVITGNEGVYEKKIKNKSVGYGRSSADEFKKYTKSLITPEIDYSTIKKDSIDDFEKLNDLLDKIESKRKPIDFVQKYMPGLIKDGKIDKMALMGMAYEEMGKHASVSTSLMTKMIQKGCGENATAEALDINKDGRVDIGEYSTSILVADSLSRSDEVLPQKIRGFLSNRGLNKSMQYLAKQNCEMAQKTYATLYDYYNLGCAKYEFLADKGNLA